MGTQQLLLIVLGVIIVGVAIAVGITIFNNQAFNNSRQAVATELSTYGTSAMQWWKTPTAQGGAGRDFVAASAVADIASYVGFTETDETLGTETGNFKLMSAADANTVVMQGIGLENRGADYPWVQATVDLVTGEITTETGVTTGATAWVTEETGS
ncbi:MAG: hypothetical protein LHW45_02255 [Candidatus Cloacimonetes bacterium]|nr:hypothetical protein [Candidatus Cloacimonadota bacterium]MDY0366438.1 hypothetical protein [Candidatus Syntrophosphaera sp.]